MRQPNCDKKVNLAHSGTGQFCIFLSKTYNQLCPHCLTVATGVRWRAGESSPRNVESPHHARLFVCHLLILFLLLLLLFLAAVPRAALGWILVCTMETRLIERDLELRMTQNKQWRKKWYVIFGLSMLLCCFVWKYCYCVCCSKKSSFFFWMLSIWWRQMLLLSSYHTEMCLSLPFHWSLWF